MTDQDKARSGAQRPITRWLASAPSPVFLLFAIACAFTTYFCMYAFRKPFAAAKYEGLQLFGTGIELKTAFADAKLSATVEVYGGANHGWTVPGSQAYNEAAAEKAWSGLSALYKKALG